MFSSVGRDRRALKVDFELGLPVTIVPPRAGVNLGWGFRPEGFDQTYIEMPSVWLFCFVFLCS